MGDRRPGFVPGRARGSGAVLRPNSPVSLPDPNADLIGYAIPVEGGLITVTGTARTPGYVDVDTPTGPSMRVTAQVRRRKELE